MQREVSLLLGVPRTTIICEIQLTINPERPCTVALNGYCDGGKLHMSFQYPEVDQKYLQGRNSFASSHRKRHGPWHTGSAQERFAELHVLPSLLPVSFNSCEREEQYAPGGAGPRSESASSSRAQATSQKLPAPDTFTS